MNLGDQVASLWNKRKERLENDYAFAGWGCCVMPEVMADCALRMKGEHRDAIERVVIKLHTIPCPNENVKGMTMPEIVDTFWNEFKDFHNKTGPWRKERWNSPDARMGKSYSWHEKYSLPYTKVFGFVACRVCSKILGIGPCERVWGDTKSIKAGKRKHLGGKSTAKRTVVYSTAKIEEARIRRMAMEFDTTGTNTMFNDDDIK